MTKISKPILFFGTEDFSLIVLSRLFDEGFSIAAVVTKPDMPKGRGHKLTPPPVKVFAESHSIPVLQPTKMVSIIDDIKSFGPVIGVLASYGKIIPNSILDLFNPGIINVHPSLLPKYRGPSPIETALLNGDETTGVSIMKLVTEMDAGPVYAQKSYTIDHQNSTALYSDLANIGASLICDILPDITDGKLLPNVQPEKDISYTHILQKSDAWLDFKALTATEAERRVRAYIEYPKSKASLSGVDITITKAHVSDVKKNDLDIACRDNHFLSVDELIAPSGKKMEGHAFLNGYAA